MKINVAYKSESYLTALTPVVEELKQRGESIYYNEDGCDTTLCCHASFVVRRWKYESIVFIWHGNIPGKGGVEGYKFWDGKIDLLLLSGPYYIDWMKEIGLGYTKYKMVGWPKDDELVNSPSTKSEIIRKYNLDPKKPVILYAPTWYDTRNLTPQTHSTINFSKEIVSQTRGYNLIVHPHERDNNNPNLKYAKNVIKDANINYLMRGVDLLLTDFSSVAISFCLLNKPIVQIIDVIEKNISSVINEFRPFEDEFFKVGHHCHVRDLKETLKDAFMNPDKFKSQRDKWKNKMFYSPGNSAHLAADAIIEFMRKGRKMLLLRKKLRANTERIKRFSSPMELKRFLSRRLRKEKIEE